MDASWLQLGMGAVLALVGGWLWVGRLSRLRHFQDTPTSRIRSAAQGHVELAGVLVERADATPLLAPLTARPCLWWRYRIEEYRRTNNRGSWRVLEHGVSTELLKLFDGTGDCLIDPRGADVLPSRRDVWTGDLRHPRGLPSTGLLAWLGGTRRYRYTEERLHAGEPLYAVGDFRSEGGGRAGLALEAARAEIVREWKGEYAGLLRRFDNNRDGKLDMAEWGRVRLAAELEAEQRHRAASEQPVRHLLARPPQGLPFVLSSHGEEVLVRRYRWKALGGALLCLLGALMVAAAWT
ncbi:hypothetical protein MST27_12855 [Pseudomonas sp. PS1]|uniref:RING-type E3 ubiquitin transferase n=1 Tax=Stutzerimonas marianensis TaxID=2929513 RepID=A0A9X1W2Z7_9GAMM|nr:GIDE domain-containing protein [Pseudomonas marianensis]MCJ0974261.1 hypothetical protein [Pseudomonas marianensis]